MIYFSFMQFCPRQSNNTQKPDWCIYIIQFVDGFWRVFVGVFMIFESWINIWYILLYFQDWDFPHFVSAIDIKLPGINTAHIKFDIPKCLKREVWQVHITGKLSFKKVWKCFHFSCSTSNLIFLCTYNTFTLVG